MAAQARPQASPAGADARPRSAAQLVEDLRNEDEAVSLKAHRRLVEMGADAVPALMKSLDGDGEVYALLILGRIGSRAETAVPELRRRRLGFSVSARDPILPRIDGAVSTSPSPSS